MVKTALHTNCHPNTVSQSRLYRVPMSSLSRAKVVPIVCNTFVQLFQKRSLRLMFHPFQNRCDTPKYINNIKHTTTRLAAVGRQYTGSGNWRWQ